MWEIISFLPVSIENFEMHFMAKHFQNVYTEFDNEPLCVDNENLKFHHQVLGPFVWVIFIVHLFCFSISIQ